MAKSRQATRHGGWMRTAAIGATLLAAAHGLAAAPADEAEAILRAAGFQGGLIAVVGCADGQLLAALGAGEGRLVHGLDADAAAVEKAREHIRALALYGRASADVWSGGRLPYADNVVNLLVLADGAGVSRQEALRVLAPGGASVSLNPQSAIRNPKWVKPRPPEMDEWTHYLHGPDNNAVAHDALVGPPQHLQWVAGPRWARSHDHLASVSGLVSSGGRLFAVVDEGPIAAVALPPRWALVARDAFNGLVLWRRPIGAWEGHLRGFRSGPPEIARRLVAVGDRVYATLGYGRPVEALDAASGKTVRTYPATEGALEIVCSGGTLFVVVGELDSKGTGGTRGPQQDLDNWLSYPQYITTGVRKRLLAVGADSGDVLWKKEGADVEALMPTTLAVAAGRALFQNPREVVCLDARTGDDVWRATRPIATSRLAWSTPTLVVHGDVVLSADRAVGSTAGSAAEGTAGPGRIAWTVSSRGGDAPVGELIAFSSKTGARLWTAPARECYNAPADVLVAGGLVWTGNLVKASDPGITQARDPLTGEVRRQRQPDQEFFSPGMGHHRCYRNKATDRYLLEGRAGVEFIDLVSGRAIAHHWVRGTCQYGVVPANGLLYAGPHACACFIQAKLNGMTALAARRGAEPAPAEPDRLEKGPAYGQIRNPQSAIRNPDDWPTYRHDAARSGRTGAAVPTNLAKAWEADLGGRLSAPVIADGKVFVAQVDTRTVHALDAGNGRRLWRFAAGGRVDSPPTVHEGLVLFGAADGYVYAVAAADGRLAWRFLAAPEDRRIVAYDQLESAWPVHGSVLVEGGAAYVAAGRSSFLDGGIRVWRLDPRTGRVLAQTCLDDRDPKTGQERRESVRGTDMDGHLPDVLSSDGESVFMRHARLNHDLAEQAPTVAHLFSSAGFLDDSWWHRTYWQVGTRMGVGYGGWPTVGNQVPAGRILACDGAAVYGYGRTAYATSGAHVGLGSTDYRLFACERRSAIATTEADASPAPAAMALAAPRPGAAKAAPKRAPRPRPPVSKVAYRWSHTVGLQVRGMVLAAETLFIAGPPAVPYRDPAATETLEGAKGGLLWAVATADGARQREVTLDAPPVFDGMAAAGGRLYLAATSGRVQCFAAAP